MTTINKPSPVSTLIAPKTGTFFVWRYKSTRHENSDTKLNQNQATPAVRTSIFTENPIRVLFEVVGGKSGRAVWKLRIWMLRMSWIW
jgi:hypothetical protein